MIADGKYIAGVDIGGTSVRIGLMSAADDNKIENLIKKPMREVLTGNDQPADLGRFIAEYIKSSGSAQIEAVSIGLPGTLDRDCKRVLNTPNVPGLNGIDLKSILESRLELPVILENDTAVLLTGDVQRLRLSGSGIYLGCYIGTGLGSSIYINGRVMKGKNGINELGHVPVYGKEDLCGCGNRGCAENYVAGRYLQELRERKYPDTHISELFKVIKGTAEYYEYIEILSVVLASAINLMDPDAVIMGGGVPHMADFPKKELLDRLYYHAMKPVPANSLNILYAGNSEDAGVYGAALLAKNMLKL